MSSLMFYCPKVFVSAIFEKRVTNRRTDGPTDGRTDKASYRDVWMHLKMAKNENRVRSFILTRILYHRSYQGPHCSYNWTDCSDSEIGFGRLFWEGLLILERWSSPFCWSKQTKTQPQIVGFLSEWDKSEVCFLTISRNVVDDSLKALQGVKRKSRQCRDSL